MSDVRQASQTQEHVGQVLFSDLCRLEPRLTQLRDEATQWHDKAGEAFCANAVWYGYSGHAGLKPRLLQLVGYDRQGGPKELQSERAYDIAYETIYEELPDCKGNCACMGML